VIDGCIGAGCGGVLTFHGSCSSRCVQMSYLLLVHCSKLVS
jgi:hypothetical protein